MKAEQAIVTASEHLAVATRVIDRVAAAEAEGRPVNREQVSLLLTTLRKATCAAQELELRASGTAEPKRGD